MPSPLLADAFGHPAWATIRVLDLSAPLDDMQAVTVVPGTHRSIIDRLRDIVPGHLCYLDDLRGGGPEPFEEAGSDVPTCAP